MSAIKMLLHMEMLFRNAVAWYMSPYQWQAVENMGGFTLKKRDEMTVDLQWVRYVQGVYIGHMLNRLTNKVDTSSKHKQCPKHAPSVCIDII